MTSQDIPELIERVRAATGPDGVLDLDVSLWVRGLRNVGGYWAEDMETGERVKISYTCDPITASIDSALALAERVLPGCVWTIEADACWLRVLTEDDVAEFQGNKAGMEGKWTPIAIVLAVLTALQSTHSGQMK